jgi:hypothetical protein
MDTPTPVWDRMAWAIGGVATARIMRAVYGVRPTTFDDAVCAVSIIAVFASFMIVLFGHIGGAW